jgi:tellurite resistance protein TerC
MSEQVFLWSVFGIVIIFMLALDLGVFHRKSHEIKLKEALMWSVAWIALSLLFNLWLYFVEGPQMALDFLTGYLIEKSLSVDNIFVFILIFNYFNVPSKFQHKVLYWGIIGAIVMRGILIAAGVALIHQFHWLIYVFGTFLVFAGAKLFFAQEERIEPDKNPMLRLLRRQQVFPILGLFYENAKFFIKDNGRLYITPLFVVLIVIETTDVVFALDSIPAILSITTDPFIVFSSNIFAILGLRALYFALAGIMQIFFYLRYGLAAILVFVGIKMILADIYRIPTGYALGVIGLVLLVSIVMSLVKRPKEVKETPIL